MVQLGDLVKDKYGTIGIVVRQVGVIDRWLVKWIDSGEITGQWGHNLHHL
jgi:hypothetical protein